MAHIFRQFHCHSLTESQSTGSDEGHGHQAASTDSDDEEGHGLREFKPLMSTKSTKSTRSKSIKDHALPQSIASIKSTVVSSFRKVASAVAGSEGSNHKKVAQCPDSHEDEVEPLAPKIEPVMSMQSTGSSCGAFGVVPTASSASAGYTPVMHTASSSSMGYIPLRQEKMATTLSEAGFQKHIQTMPFFGVIKSQLHSLASKRKHQSSASLEEDIRHLCVELAMEIRNLTVQEHEDKRKKEKAQFMREITALRDQCLARPKHHTEPRKQDIQYYGTLNELNPATQELVSAYADEHLKMLLHEADLNPNGELAQRISKMIDEERVIFKGRNEQLVKERDEFERELQGAKTALEDCDRFRQQVLDLEEALAQQRQAAEAAEQDRLAARARLATVQRALGEARRVLRTGGTASGGDELASDTPLGGDEPGCARRVLGTGGTASGGDELASDTPLGGDEPGGAQRALRTRFAASGGVELVSDAPLGGVELGRDIHREAGVGREQEGDGARDDVEDGRDEDDGEDVDDAEEDADDGDDEDDGGDIKTTTFTTIEQTTSVTSTTTTVVETTTSACGERRRQSDAARDTCGHGASRPPLPGAGAADLLRYATSLKDQMVQEASPLRHAVVFIGALGRFEEKFYAELLQEAGKEGSRAPAALTWRYSSARKEGAGLQQLCADLLEAFDDVLDIAGADCTAAEKVGRIRKRLWTAHATSKANLLQLHANSLEDWRRFESPSPESAQCPEKADSGPVPLSASPGILSPPSASQVPARSTRGSMAVKSQGRPSTFKRPTVVVPTSTMIVFDGEPEAASPTRGPPPSKGPAAAAAATSRDNQLARPSVVNTVLALPQIVQPPSAKTVFVRSSTARRFTTQSPSMPSSPRGRKTLIAEDDAAPPSTPRGQSPCSPVVSTKARPLGTRH